MEEAGGQGKGVSPESSTESGLEVERCSIPEEKRLVWAKRRCRLSRGL